MKVLLINGSPRQHGNTAIALAEIAKQLGHERIESEIVWIGNKPIRGCIACGQCKAKGLGQCVFDDDICNRISEKFSESNALIVGSPVYYGQPNGSLLSSIQRAFYSNGANISGKPAASIAVCRRGGATAVFESLNMPFQMMNMPIVTSQYWNIVTDVLKVMLPWIQRDSKPCVRWLATWHGYFIRLMVQRLPDAQTMKRGKRCISSDDTTMASNDFQQCGSILCG